MNCNNILLKYFVFGLMPVVLLLAFSSSRAAEKTKADVYIAQGMLLLERGRLEEAESKFEKALEQEPRNAEAHFRIGHVNLLRNNLDRALDYMLQATNIEPKNVLYATNVAYVYERMNQLGDAIREYERILNSDVEASSLKPVEKNMTLASGRLLAKKGEINAALLLFNGLLLEYPEDKQVLQNIALAYLNLNRFEEAEATLSKMEKISPNDASLQMRLADLYEKQGKLELSVQHLKRYLDIIQRGPEAKQVSLRMLMIQGDIALKKKEWDKAVSFFEKALAVDQRLLKAHFNRAMALAEAGKYTDAEKGFKDVLVIDPEHLAARLNLGSVYINLKHYDKAKESFEYVIKYDASGVLESQAKIRMNYLHTVIADAALQQGNLEESIRQYEKALEFDSGNVRAAFNRGILLVEQQRFEEAAPEFEAVLVQMPENLAVRMNLANVYEELGRLSDAVKQYKEVIALNKASNEGLAAQFRLPFVEGRAYLNENKPEIAEPLFLKSLEIDPNNPNTYLFLGAINSSKGELRKAAQYYQAMLNLAPEHHPGRLLLAQIYELLELDSLAVQEYRRVLFTSRESNEREQAKLRLDAVESRLSGFSRYLSYAFQYQDNYGSSPDNPIAELNSNLNFDVRFSHKFDDQLSLGLRFAPSYSNLHYLQQDSLQFLFGGNLRYATEDGGDWATSYIRSNTRILIEDQTVSHYDAYSFSRGIKLDMPAIFGLAPKSYVGKKVPTMLRNGLNYTLLTDESKGNIKVASGSWSMTLEQPMLWGVSFSGGYSYAIRRNLMNYSADLEIIRSDENGDPIEENITLYDSRDFESNSHQFNMSFNKTLGAGFDMTLSIGATVNYFINPDRDYLAQYQQEIHRQNTTLIVGAQFNYFMVKDIVFFANLSLTKVTSNLPPRQFTFLQANSNAGNEGAQAASALQSDSMGAYTNSSASLGIQMAF